MNKSTHFSGTPIIKQILKYLPQEDITRTAKTYNSDKKFKTYDHLVTMLYATNIKQFQLINQMLLIELS